MFFFSLLCLLQSQVATARILDHETWIVNPIVSGSYIAEVISADLEMIDDQDFERVLQLLLQYKVLAFRNQSSLSVEGQRAFSKRFGELHVHLESASHFEGHKDVNLVSNIKNENGGYIGLYGKHVELFHTDLSWYKLFLFFRKMCLNSLLPTFQGNNTMSSDSPQISPSSFKLWRYTIY